MEAANEGCKLVAKAKELITIYLNDQSIENSYFLKDAQVLLDMAIDKLTSST